MALGAFFDVQTTPLEGRCPLFRTRAFPAFGLHFFLRKGAWNSSLHTSQTRWYTRGLAICPLHQGGDDDVDPPFWSTYLARHAGDALARGLAQLLDARSLQDF